MKTVGKTQQFLFSFIFSWPVGKAGIGIWDGNNWTFENDKFRMENRSVTIGNDNSN
jgi:hypothetical protein